MKTIVIAATTTELKTIETALKDLIFANNIEIHKATKSIKALCLINKYEPEIVISVDKLEDTNYCELLNLSPFKNYKLILLAKKQTNNSEIKNCKKPEFIVDLYNTKNLQQAFKLAIKISANIKWGGQNVLILKTLRIFKRNKLIHK